jgi:hypothetical protein
VGMAGGKKQLKRVRGTPWVFFVYAAVAKGHKSKIYFVPPSGPAGTKARKDKQPFSGAHFRKLM